jgi:hypothetical protein
MENGRDHRDVVEMDASEVWIVDDDHVARPQPIYPVEPEGVRDELHHIPEMNWVCEGLGDDPQVPIKQTTREIAARLHVR